MNGALIFSIYLAPCNYSPFTLHGAYYADLS